MSKRRMAKFNQSQAHLKRSWACKVEKNYGCKIKSSRLGTSQNPPRRALRGEQTWQRGVSLMRQDAVFLVNLARAGCGQVLHERFRRRRIFCMRGHERDDVGGSRSSAWEPANHHEIRLAVAHQIADVRAQTKLALARDNRLTEAAAVRAIFQFRLYLI